MEKYIRNESETLKSINNLNTIRLIEHLENDVAHLFVMEYCDQGTLLDHLMKQGSNYFPERDILTIFSQILNGLHAIHKEGFLHRDLKLENILLKKEKKVSSLIVKIADFGFSRFLPFS